MAAIWQSIRVYYYDPNKDNLLLDCIRPLFTMLQERHWVEQIYFVRHWYGGSHIRLQLLADPTLFQSEIVPYVQREVRAYLQKAPATTLFSEEDAQRLYQRRDRMALEHSTYKPLSPNNSIEIAPYEDLANTIGSQGAAKLLTEYYTETNDLAFTLLEKTRNNYTARLSVCFDQLAALVATSPFLPLGRAYMSYRSHVEAYITCEPAVEEPRLRRNRLEKAYEQRQKAVEQRIQRLLILIEKAPERLPSWLTSMIEIYQRYGERAFQGAQEGVIQLKTNEDFEENKQGVRVEESAYRMAVINNEAVLRSSNEPIIIAHRIELNFLYLHLSRIGMLNEDRYMLDYYIANVIEKLLDIDPVALMSAPSK